MQNAGYNTSCSVRPSHCGLDYKSEQVFDRMQVQGDHRQEVK